MRRQLSAVVVIVPTGRCRYVSISIDRSIDRSKRNSGYEA